MPKILAASLAVSLALFLAGCTAMQWVHPTKSQDEFRRDVYDCEQVGYQYAANLGRRFAGNPLIVVDEQIRCVQLKHGWTRVPVGTVRQPAQSATTCPPGTRSDGQGCRLITGPVAADVICPAGTHRAGDGCLSDRAIPYLPPATEPTWATGE